MLRWIGNALLAVVMLVVTAGSCAVSVGTFGAAVDWWAGDEEPEDDEAERMLLEGSVVGYRLTDGTEKRVGALEEAWKGRTEGDVLVLTGPLGDLEIAGGNLSRLYMHVGGQGYTISFDEP